MDKSLLARLKRFDDSRPGVPGEHLFALAGGIWLLARGGSLLGRVAGLALIARAVTGRDGLLKGPIPALGWNGRTGQDAVAPSADSRVHGAPTAPAEVQAAVPLAV